MQQRVTKPKSLFLTVHMFLCPNSANSDMTSCPLTGFCWTLLSGFVGAHSHCSCAMAQFHLMVKQLPLVVCGDGYEVLSVHPRVHFLMYLVHVDCSCAKLTKERDWSKLLTFASEGFISCYQSNCEGEPTYSIVSKTPSPLSHTIFLCH